MEITTIVVIAIAALLTFLVLREVICWYYRINEIVKLLKEQNELLKKLTGRND